MTDGIVIEWLGGNCPVQAEGTFDGVAFYFRARGTQVTCDVGPWGWHGPEYEWPDAGWISEDVARTYIGTAYRAWLRRNSARAEGEGRRKRHNDLMGSMVHHINEAATLEREMGEDARAVIDWHMAKANEINAKMHEPEEG